MKKYVKFLGLALIVLIIPVIFIGCKREKEDTLSSYQLSLSYNEESKMLFGKEDVNYINTSDNLLNEIYFHLYPNAFRENAKNKVVSLSKEDDAYPHGKSYGKIEINEVAGDNGELEYSIGGEDENILKVSLEKGIYPDENVNISITFSVSLANINHRLGYGDNVINFGNFYPIACVYENGKGFAQSLYHSNGDPFYSDVANYSVSLEFPNSFSLASSGEVLKVDEKSGNKIASIKADKVRDFAFCLSKKFTIVSQEVAGTTISYYGYETDENLKECMSTSAAALEFFNEKFGKYPYKTLAVVKTNFVHGGMEYPGLVMISDECQTQQDYDYVIVHEIAHQWWYGLVGNDEYNAAWMDEGLAEYSTFLFFEEHESDGFNYDQLIKTATENYKFFVKVYSGVLGEVDTSMNRALNEFDTEPEYVNCVYTKGSLLFHAVRENVGEKKFDKAVKEYFEKYKYKNARPEELVASFIKSTGRNLESFFSSYLEGKDVII